MIGTNSFGRHTALCETLESRQLYSSTVGTDATFGQGGVFTTFEGYDNASPSDAITLKDGRLLVAGVSYTPKFDQIGLFALYNADGTLAKSFDGDGKKVLSLANSKKIGYITDLQQTKDGNILVVGQDGMFKLKLDGYTDGKFGKDGYAAYATPADFDHNVVQLDDGSFRVGNYDNQGGILHLDKYTNLGKVTQTLKRAIGTGVTDVLYTATNEVAVFGSKRIARAYATNLADDKTFGTSGKLDFTSAFNAWAKTKATWYRADNEETTATVPSDWSVNSVTLGKNGYVFTGYTGYVSDKTPRTFGKYEEWTNPHFYVGKTGSAITLDSGNDIDGTKLSATAVSNDHDDPYFGAVFHTTTNQYVSYNPFSPVFGNVSGINTNEVISAGNGKFYVIGEGSADDAYTGGFLITRTNYVG